MLFNETQTKWSIRYKGDNIIRNSVNQPEEAAKIFLILDVAMLPFLNLIRIFFLKILITYYFYSFFWSYERCNYDLNAIHRSI